MEKEAMVKEVVAPEMCAMQEDHGDQEDHRTHHHQQLPEPFICISWKRCDVGHCIIYIIRVMRIIAIIHIILFQ